jgi:hypothetical protein
MVNKTLEIICGVLSLLRLIGSIVRICWVKNKVNHIGDDRGFEKKTVSQDFLLRRVVENTAFTPED